MKSQYAGKCKGFKNSDGNTIIHSWEIGTDIFYQKEPKCICSDKECFDAQLTANGPSTPGGNVKTPAATIECRIASLKAFIDSVKGLDPQCWPACAGVWNATK